MQRPQLGYNFLNQVNQGKTRWGVYFVSFLVIAGLWIMGSAVFMLLVYSGNLASGEPLDGTRPFADFAALGLTFIALLIGLWVAIVRIHRRPFLSLVTPAAHIRWPRLFYGFGLQCIVIFGVALIEELLMPGTYRYTLDPDRFYKFAILIILLIPFQAATEELLFRGYLLQIFGHFTRQPLILVILNGSVFMALHYANPEMEYGLPAWLSYFAWGAFLTLLTLKDGSAELAIGIHIANNMFTAAFVNYKDSALSTNAVFTAQEIHAWYALISYILSAGIMYWLFFRNHQIEPLVEQKLRS